MDDALSLFGDKPLTAREVADKLWCDRSTAFAKLTILDDAGELRSKQIAK